jgi:hypothetical protein
MRIRIGIRRIHMFLGLPDPDPLVRDTDPAPDPDPSIIKQNSKENIDSYCFVTSV